MLLPVIASLTLFHPFLPKDDPPRLRTLLDNGAVVLVEPMPKEPLISVQLFASSSLTPETEATHGYRHLLEHLLVRGDGSLDRRLETASCLIKASTFRDAMQIELLVGADQLPLALEAIRGLLKRPEFDQEDLDRELRVMRNEFAMKEFSSALSILAWKAAYGDSRLDPAGTFDSIYRATPEKLLATFDRQFAPQGLALVIAGPVDLDKASAMGRAVLEPLAKSRLTTPATPREGKPIHVVDDGSECWAVPVPSFKMPQTAAALAAALAIASETPGSFVTYTPSVQNGLVIVGNADAGSLGAAVADIPPGALFSRGVNLAKAWVRRQLSSASGVGYLRGLLLCQGIANRPETIVDALDALTPAQFEQAFRRFSESGREAAR